MIVRELLARMGVVVDESSVRKAEGAIGRFAETAKHALEAYGVFKLYEFVQQKFEGIAQTAAHLEHLAQKTGMSTRALQELGYAAEQTGVDAGELQMGLTHLARSAFEAMTTGGAAGGAFHRLGIEVRDGAGKLKPTNHLLGEVADKFAAMDDGPEKVALSMQLFSRAGAQLIPLLEKGSAGISKWGADARKTGGLMSEALIKRGEELHHGLVRLQYAFQGLTYAVLGPFVKAVAEGKNSLAGWIAAHREFIALGVEKVVSLVAQAFHVVALAVEKAKVPLMILAGVLLAIESPMLLFFGALIFALADLDRYVSGQDSVLGRLIYALSRLGHEFEEKGPFRFIAAAFIDGLKSAKDLFTYLNDQMNKPGVGTTLGAIGGFAMAGPAGAVTGAIAGSAGALARQNVPMSMVQAPVTININGAGGDPNSIASKVKEAMQDFWDHRVRLSENY